MRLINVSAKDKRQLNMAIELLRRVFPDQYDWFMHVVTTIDGRTPACGCDEKTVACTLPSPDTTILVGFHQRISNITAPELAIVLSHESRHWGPVYGSDTQLREIKHRCSDPACLQPWERAMDPIYSVDAMLRPQLTQYWSLHSQEIEAKFPAPAEFPWKEVGAAAGVLLAIWWGLVGLGGAAVKK